MKRTNKVQAYEKLKQDKAFNRQTLEIISEAVEMEKDPYIKCLITILANTGMHIGDLLKLATSCIHKDSTNRDIISWHDSKIMSTSNPLMLPYIPDRSTYTIPIPRGCVVVIEELIEATKGLREQADKSISDYLFIFRANDLHSNEIKQMTALQLQRLLKSFVKRNNILDINGEPLNLSFHHLRHAFFNKLIDDNNISFLAKDRLKDLLSETQDMHSKLSKDNGEQD